MTPELREARRGMLTGSMAAVIMGGLATDGLARYVNRLAFERLFGLPEGEDFQSAAMTAGIERERSALEWYAFDQDCTLIPGDQFMIHPELSFVGATPDSRRSGRTVQVKCPQASTWAATVRAGVVPAEYRHQCRWEMWVAGVSLCDFVCWHPLGGGKIIPFSLDAEAIAVMAERATHVNSMVEQAMQEITNSRS